jgi:hypothetical protein
MFDQKNTRKSSLFRWLPLLVPLLLSCSSDNSRSLHLLDKKPEIDADAEAARLRKMQLIRVLDTSTTPPTENDVSVSTIDEALYFDCGAFYCGNITTDGCENALCYAQAALCSAKAEMAAALPQSGSVTFGNWIIPPQATAAAAALAVEAGYQAGDATYWAYQGLDDLFNVTTTHYYCQAADAVRNDAAGTPFATALAAAYADAHHTFEETTEIAIKSTIDASDAQYSSTNSLSTAVARAVSGTALSRTAAAHLLTQGDPGLLGSTTKGFCSNPELSPQGTAALSVFRDSALSPVAVLNNSITIDVLLDDVGAAVPNGSVRQRIAEMYQYPALLTGTPVEQYYGLTPSAFSEARTYLQDEINAFSRSLASTSVLPAKKLAGGGTTTYPRFSATAGAPLALPAAYYAAIARYTTIAEDPEPDPPYDDPYDGLDKFVDGSISHAAMLLKAQSNAGVVVPPDGLGPLALLVAAKERIARFTFSNTGTTSTIFVDGLTATDGVRFLVGEDQLRCAVQGSVEGAPCTDIGTPITVANTPIPNGFSSSLKLTPFTVTAGPKRVYIVRLKPGLSNTTAAPGQYTALTGASVDTSRANRVTVPVLPNVERRLAEILQPNKSWCAHSSTTCAGAEFDERLPLENELSSDQDGVESSWKHYLAQAKDAAAQADALGTDYINTGLQQTQNELDEETRQEQQRERADDEAEKLQSLCGTSFDPHDLVTLLSTGSSLSPSITKASGPACTTDANCNPPGTTGYACTFGRCIVDLAGMAAANNTTYPDLKRLADCVSDQQLTHFVSLGKDQVCLWYASTNPNLICQNAAPNQKCPKLHTDPNKSCADELGTLPGSTIVDHSINVPFFDNSSSDGANPPSQVCSTYRQLRVNPSQEAQLFHQLEDGFPFDSSKLRDAGHRLTYEMRYGGFAAIDVDRNPKFTTGNAFAGGPNTSAWPCQTPANPSAGTPITYPGRPSECTPGTGSGPGMLCQYYDCTNPTERAKANYMMLRAVLGAETIAGGGVGAVTFRLGQGLVTRVDRSAGTWGSPLGPSDTVSFFNGANVRRVLGFLLTKYHSNAPTTDLSWIPWYFEDGTTPSNIATDGDSGESQLFAAKALWDDKKPWPPLRGFDQTSRTDKDPWVVRRLRGVDTSDLAIAYRFGYINQGPNEIGPVVDASFNDPGTYTHADADYSYLTYDPAHYGVSINGEDALNGYELLCGVGENDMTATVSLAAPPTVTSVADLSRVAKYITSLSQAIKDQAATRLYANIPTVAMSALQQAGGDGAYPQYAGQMGDAISKLRGGLVRLQETVPQLSNEVAAFGYDIQTLHDTLTINANDAKLDDLQMYSNVSNQLAACASTIGIGSILSLSTAATCANSAVQIILGARINDIQKQNTQLQSDIATQDFGAKFSSHATNIQTLALHFAEASEDVDASLASIEGLRADAKVSLARVIDLSSYQAQSAAAVTTVIGNLFDGKQLRYQKALTNAKRMAFLAKRAIEQRIGVKLSDLREPLPLVDAPSSWEANLCDLSGVDYNSLLVEDDPKLSSAGGAQKFAEGFIGDYVTKLENVVESYQLVNNFHEGTDTAVISLRDDIMNVRASCPVASPNLLYQSSNLQQFGTPGWAEEGCTMQTVNDVQVPADSCVSVDNAGPIPAAVLPDPALAAASSYLVKFGGGATAATKLDQTVSLNSGFYRLSWYTPDVAGANAGFVSATSGAITPVATTTAPQIANTWGRRFITFKVASDGVTASRPVTVGFARLATGTTSFTVAGPMLEKLPSIVQDYALSPFVGTSDSLTTMLPSCQDTDGSVFRANNWQVGCQQLCADGFSSQCDSAAAQTYCYHQTSFGLSQRDIQLGKVLNFSGFARGNFNYRIDSIALNFVGTGTRDCSTSDSPTACAGAGFIPYTLDHVGPFYVRNYQGVDFRAQLFDGSIEHARGLGSERYITNPISSSDQGLLDQYTRSEFQGRPLDGNFVLKVWDGEGTNFDAIQDVQFVIKYRYWTRFN